MLARIRRTFLLLLMLLGLPGFGLGVAYILGFSLHQTTVAQIFAGTSVFAAVAGLALLMLVWLAAILCGARRERLVVVFRILVRFVAVLVGILVVIQGGIVVVGVALLENYLTHAVSLGLIGPMAAGVLYGAYEMVEAAFEAVRRQDMMVAGIVVTEAEQPRLWQRIRAVAARLNARVPDHVILGIDPNFFATAANVRLAGANMRLSGETLYLSAPLMGVLSESELSAVLGHELAHFQKADTEYSQRFLPVYQGLALTLAATDRDGRAHGLAFLPARAVLGFTLSRFARAERSINRSREIEADRAGADVAGATSVIAALVKIGAADPAWNRVVQAGIQAINRGEAVENMSQAVIVATRGLIEEAPPEALLAMVEDRRQPHPTDSHPTLAARAAALGVPLEPALVRFDANEPSSFDLLEEREATERSLTQCFADHLIARGFARPASGLQRRTAFQMKRDTLAKRAAARKQALAVAASSVEGEPVGSTDAGTSPSAQ